MLTYNGLAMCSCVNKEINLINMKDIKTILESKPKVEDYDRQPYGYINALQNYINKLEEQLRIASVSNRYFVFSGQEDNKPTKYLVDDCKDRETAIAKIETEYPNFKWVMTETFNGC